MVRLLVTHRVLEEGLARATGDGIAWGSAGLSSLTGADTVFIRGWSSATLPEPGLAIVALMRQAEDGPWAFDQLTRWQPGIPTDAPLAIIVVRGRGEAATVVGWLRVPGAPPVPISSTRLVGPGMHLLTASASESSVVPTRWSRTVGALGPPTWRRLRDLSFAIVGAGRTGSLVSDGLARAGVRQLTLIDPDRVEPGNLDAMLGTGTLSVGRPKVEVLADAARSAWTDIDARAVLASASSVLAHQPIAESDIIVTTVDHDGARAAANHIAAMYLRPLIDIGTGIPSSMPAIAGADIRLVLPGEACLWCFGGLGNAAEVGATREGPLRERDQQLGRVWFEERAGSLRSVNAVATGIGQRLIESFVSGHLDRSTWVQVTFTQAGMPEVVTRSPNRRMGCPICTFAGSADHGMRWPREMAGIGDP